MSVFHNIYTSKFESTQEALNAKSLYEDFNFFDIYLTTVINTFSWQGEVPRKLPRFMVEKFLQESGRIAGYKEGEDFKIFPCFPAGKILENGEYNRYTIIKPNGESIILGDDEIEICFNNCFKLPYIYKIWHFAEKSSFALKAVDSALRKAVIPTIIECEDESDLKMIEGILDDNKKLAPIMATVRAKFNDGKMSRMTAFDNRDNDIIALWDVYVRYRNLFYSTFGINNIEIQKKERLTQAEGAGNDEIVRYSLLDDMYRNRKDFCQRCKDHFGVEIGVEINRDTQTVFELNRTNEQKIESAIIEISNGSNIEKPAKKIDEEGETADEV